MNVGFAMRTEIANSAVNASVIFVHWSMMGLKDSTRTPSTAGEYKPRERETAQNRRLPPSEGETRVPWYQHTDAQCRHTYVNFHPHPLYIYIYTIRVRITVSVLESFSSIYISLLRSDFVADPHEKREKTKLEREESYIYILRFFGFHGDGSTIESPPVVAAVSVCAYVVR